MLNSGKNWRLFVPHDLEIWRMTLKNNRAPLLYYIKLCAAFQSHWQIQTGVTVWERSIRVKIGDFFVPGDFENWHMTLKNNTASLLYDAKLCASFQIHWWSQTYSYSLEMLKSGKNWRFFLSRVTSKIYLWPYKTIGHLSYAASTFVHHFIANGEFKLELQSRNAQFGSK